MDKTDALGRRRRPSQNRGLRSLFPKLPGEYESRVIRLAMHSAAWKRIASLVSLSSAPTLPRAYGELMEQLLETFDSPSRFVRDPFTQVQPGPREDRRAENRGDWQAWQMQKELALLAASAPERWQSTANRGLQ